MKQVCLLIECYEGEEPFTSVYGVLGDAVNQASELASLRGWEKVDGELKWEEPGAYYNYIEIRVERVL